MKKKKLETTESMTFFDMQEEAWFANNCKGNIEDYDGTEIEETDDNDP